ncbi:MAG: DUF1998 domain-containing protein [Caldilineaceae bacterium]|nr:DUF1998 domain-containing protein [Caldilineaceae bacterium]
MTNDRVKVGEVRPSQLMFTYGIGSVVDLPYLSALVMGLDDWRADPSVAPTISEDRLLRAVRYELGGQVVKLVAPPAVADDFTTSDPFSPANLVGVPVATFPRWMLCPRCERLASLDSGLFKLDPQPWRPEYTRYIHVNCNRAKNPPVVPARFLVACENGHLDDFPWIDFVHQGRSCASPTLRLIEYGPGGEARDLEVRCDECNAVRRMSDAFGESGRISMPGCRGRRPHLRDYAEDGCDKQAKAMLLGASNLWFPVVLTTLAIPTESARLEQLVEQHWGILQNLQNLQNVTLLRQIGQMGDFMGYGDDEIWQAIERKRHRDLEKLEEIPTDLKTPEWQILSQPNPNNNNDDLRLRSVPTPSRFSHLLDKVVLVERLREVRALVGFTRIDSPGELDETLAVGGVRAPLSRRQPAWVPATDVRGEGIFLQFQEQAIQRWLAKGELTAYNSHFRGSHRTWRLVRGIQPEDDNYPGLRYVLLHSFAHALMRQLALACGYTAASLRERIYSRNPNEIDGRPDPMAGILIYTAAPDSEGTLGGLVALGEPQELERHITTALHSAQLCASDPLCAEHEPSKRGLTLHAAACHACLFAPETSCERGNRYLDRTVLAPTVERADLAFFE